MDKQTSDAAIVITAVLMSIVAFALGTIVGYFII